MMQQNENAAHYFVDRHASGPVSQKSAFIEADGEERTLTYAQLAEESGKLAELFSKHGIDREDRIAMLVLDKIEFPIIFWGALKFGVIPIAINTLLGADIYDTILRDSRAKALFVSQELLHVLASLTNTFIPIREPGP